MYPATIENKDNTANNTGKNTGKNTENNSVGMTGHTKRGIQATWQVLYLIGWKYCPVSQKKPAERGSQNVSLKDLHVDV